MRGGTTRHESSVCRRRAGDDTSRTSHRIVTSSESIQPWRGLSRRLSTPGYIVDAMADTRPAPAHSYELTTDPRKVDRPVDANVHPALTGAWQVNNLCSMAYIFDAVNPAMKFKRGTRFDPDKRFPKYRPEDSGDATETDAPSPGLMPYMPETYR